MTTERNNAPAEGSGCSDAPAGDADQTLLPQELLAQLPAPTLVDTEAGCRAALVRLGLCHAGHAPVTLELYGGLRLKTRHRTLPLRAETVGGAIAVLKAVYPALQRMLPEGAALAEHYRFSINGEVVGHDLDYRLAPEDHVVLFNASVGG